MTQQPYKHPPIIEAIIELRFASALDVSALEKINKKYKNLYDNTSKKSEHQLKVEFTKQKVIKKSQDFYRYTSRDQTEIAILKLNSLLISKLAPYNGWSEFIERFKRDWSALIKASRFHELNRIGVRYVNRIDMPISDKSEIIEEDDYLTVFPKFPTIMSPANKYGVNIESSLEDIGSILVINSAVVPSPIRNHASLILDQDISKDKDVPQTFDGVVDYLNTVRNKKNDIFEECITDNSRELFKT